MVVVVVVVLLLLLDTVLQVLQCRTAERREAIQTVERPIEYTPRNM